MNSITVKQLTQDELVRELCARTINAPSKADLAKLLDAGHSPIRGVTLKVDMLGIYSFVSVHLVRHNVGVQHFVQSLRDDRGGNGQETRYSPVNHTMLINAEALVNMAHKRLCKNAHREARSVVSQIAKACPSWMHPMLVPMCEYRGGYCHEVKTCGAYPRNEKHGAWAR